MIGWHLQGGGTGWVDATRHLPEWSVVKFVDGGQRAAEAKAVNPGIHCSLRHHVGEQNPPGFMPEYEKFIPSRKLTDEQNALAERRWYTQKSNAFFRDLEQSVVAEGGDDDWDLAVKWTPEAMKNHARQFFASFVDGSFNQFAKHLDTVSEYNEYFANSQSSTEKARWIAWATACVEVWRDEYRPTYPWIGLVLAETAVGNDIPIELAALSHQYDWVHLGYHPYVPVWEDQIRPDAWRWYSGRWHWMDESYRAAGYNKVTWFFGEFGAVGHNGPGWPNSLAPNNGWRHSEVYNGNLGKYHVMMLDWMNRVAETPAWKQGRVIGATIFTSGGWELWKWFEMKGSDIINTGKFIGANSPIPGDDPVDPPPEGIANAHFQKRDWWDIPGTNKQQPADWIHSFTYIGNTVPSGRFKATILSETVHKFVIPTPPDTKPTLPPEEGKGGVTEGHTWDDGRDGLVLWNPNTLKTFGAGQWHDKFRQTSDFGVENAGKRYKITVYIDIHWHGYPPGNNPPEDEDIMVFLKAGEGNAVETSHSFPEHTWHKVSCIGTTDDAGKLKIQLDIEARWAHPRSIFIGGFTAEEDDSPLPVKCHAREPYAREYWVLPTHTTLAQHIAIIDASRKEGRRTVGYSYDDAGIGCGLKSRTVVLFGILPGAQHIYLNWYNKYYTGTIVEFRPLPVVLDDPDGGLEYSEMTSIGPRRWARFDEDGYLVH